MLMKSSTFNKESVQELPSKNNVVTAETPSVQNERQILSAPKSNLKP